MFIAIMSTLSERLKQARQHAGLTQDEAALLEKYRGSDATGKTAIQRVAESLTHYDASASEKADRAA